MFIEYTKRIVLHGHKRLSSDFHCTAVVCSKFVRLQKVHGSTRKLHSSTESSFSSCQLKRNGAKTLQWTNINALEGLTVNEAAKMMSESCYGRKNFDDSFFICDLGDVAKKHKKWTKLFPRIRPYLAVKVAPYGPLVGALSVMGGAFECASEDEVDLVLKYADDIVFGNPYKKISHIEHASKHGVKKFVFDHETELLKLKKHHPSAELLLRIETEDSTAHFSLSDRFGANMNQSRELIKLAQDLQMKIIGLCFHPGSGVQSTTAHTKAISDSRELFDYAKTFGMDFTILDIGGGFPGNLNSKLQFEEIASCVNENIDKCFPAEEYGNIKIIAEPGRYYSSTAFTFATHVLSKLKPKNKTDVDVEYVMGDGKFGCLAYLNDFEEGEAVPFSLKECSNEVRHFARIAGPTCDSEDIVADRIWMPELDEGDWLFWKNAGAYTFSFTTGFNGFKTDAFYNIISKENEDVFWELVNDNLVATKEHS